MAEGAAVQGTILVVDDDAAVLQTLRTRLTKQRYEVVAASSGSEAFAELERRAFNIDCVLTDLYMPGVSGMDVLSYVREQWPDIAVIMITGIGDIASAVNAIRAGAYDYLLKPFQGEGIDTAVRRAVERRRILTRSRSLEQRLEIADRFGGIVGSSPPMRRVFETIATVAPTDATVLVLGESGTGKELVARSIHDQSRRAGKTFVALNCGALAETLLESEMFGHERGAFTGAVSARRGLFEEASGGTLFLDEVGELAPATQVRLLRTLQEGQIRPLGSSRTRPVDVRIVAATNKDLEDEVREKRFRDDLYYRLNVVSIELPPLRERGEDLLLLAQHLLVKHASRARRNVVRFEPEVLELLMRYEWPGNVRELENTIERAVIMTQGDAIPVEALPTSVRNSAQRISQNVTPELPFNEARTRFEVAYLSRLLSEAGGNVTLAARRAGLDRSNFRRLLQRRGLALSNDGTDDG